MMRAFLFAVAANQLLIAYAFGRAAIGLRPLQGSSSAQIALWSVVGLQGAVFVWSQWLLWWGR